MGAPRVPARIYEGLEAVVATKRCSLYQRSKVARIAAELGHDEAAAWVMEDKSRYAAGLFHGFVIEGEEEEEEEDAGDAGEPARGTADGATADGATGGGASDVPVPESAT